MKTLLLSLLALATISLATGCASRATVGTSHHHVSLGGDVH